MSTLFPSIIPGEDFIDDTYNEAELERMEWDEIREIAATVDTDEINGHSDRDTMEETLEGMQRV